MAIPAAELRTMVPIRQRQQSEYAEVQARAYYGPQHVVVTEGGRGGVIGVDDHLADREGHEPDDLADDESHDAVDERLGGENPVPARHRGHADLDQPGRVLRSDRQHAEHGDSQLGQAHPAGAGRGRIPLALVARRHLA